MNSEIGAKSWVIGNTVIYPVRHYDSVEEWLVGIRDKMPQWEDAFLMREKELYRGVQWNKLTKALVHKIHVRLDELEIEYADEGK